mgnify:FL=1|jgi:hypothetical protein
MMVFDKLNQLWIDKPIAELKAEDLIKHTDEQTAIVEKITIDTNNTIIVYLKPYLGGESNDL